MDSNQAEENILRMKRTLQSMTDELIRKSELYMGIEGSTSLFEKALDLLFPSAHAQYYSSSNSQHPLHDLSRILDQFASYAYFGAIWVGWELWGIFDGDNDAAKIKSTLLRVAGAVLLIGALNLANWGVKKIIEADNTSSGN